MLQDVSRAALRSRVGRDRDEKYVAEQQDDEPRTRKQAPHDDLLQFD